MERRICRILDANFNRGREALRTAEEFCRFVMENEPFSARAKQMRHRLSSAIGKLDLKTLLSARDSESDVGRGLEISEAQSRGCLEDCFTAAMKRATEALRVLAEVSQIDNPGLSAEFERLRFETYTLEKEVMLGLPRSRFSKVRLYVLIPADPDTADSEVLDLAEACLEGGADALQLWAKGLSDDRFFDLAIEFTALCRKQDGIGIINDRVDIAALSGADGVHLGQNDLPAEQARKLFFGPALVGVSTHNEQELRSALAAGADYVGIGACFTSPTKPEIAVSGLDYVRKAIAVLKDSSVGHVAIGGITVENLPLLVETGVQAAAVASAVCGADDPKRACQRIKQILIQNNQ